MKKNRLSQYFKNDDGSPHVICCNERLGYIGLEHKINR